MAAFLKIDFAGIQRLERSRDLDARPGAVAGFAVGTREAGSCDLLPGEMGRGGFEAGRVNAHARNKVRVEQRRERLSLDPVGAHLLKGRIGSAARGIVAGG